MGSLFTNNMLRPVAVALSVQIGYGNEIKTCSVRGIGDIGVSKH